MTFVKGKVTNPKGRPRIPKEIAVVKVMSKQMVETAISLMLNKKVTELEAILKDKSRPTLDHFIGRIIMKGIVEGDHQRLEFLFQRVIGRVKDQIDISMPEPYIVESVGGDKRIECGMKTLEAEIIT
jgi:signal recognition particle subunit SEC65